MLKLIVLISLMSINAYSGSLEPRFLGSGKILDHLLRLERTVSRLSTEQEHTESEIAEIQSQLLSAKSTIITMNSQLLSANSKIVTITSQVLSAEEIIATMSKTSSNITNRLNVVAAQYKNLTSGVGGNAGSVAFEVRLRNHQLNLGNNAIFKFNEVTLNKGAAYNPQTGIFTAPVTGTYHFWAVITAYGKSYFRIELIRDGKKLVHGYTSRIVDNGSAPLVYVCNVNKGQRVWFQNHGPKTNLLGDVYSSYGGMLLTTA